MENQSRILGKLNNIMGKITGEQQLINRSSEDVFAFLSNFNNFEHLMPEQIINWKSTIDNCSFTIKGMADLALKYEKKHPSSLIVIIPDGKAPFEYKLICNINAVDASNCKASLDFDVELNPIMSMMASKPLQNFVNILAVKLKEYMESHK